MEYLVLVGSNLEGSLAQTLGEYAPFFWAVVAPAGLFILWFGSVYALWQTWFGRKTEEEGGGGLFIKLISSLVMVVLILGSGTGLEFLLLDDGHVHSELFGGLLDLVTFP